MRSKTFAWLAVGAAVALQGCGETASEPDVVVQAEAGNSTAYGAFQHVMDPTTAPAPAGLIPEDAIRAEYILDRQITYTIPTEGGASTIVLTFPGGVDGGTALSATVEVPTIRTDHIKAGSTVSEQRVEAQIERALGMYADAVAAERDPKHGIMAFRMTLNSLAILSHPERARSSPVTWGAVLVE